MLDRICRKHNIPYINLRPERTGNSCVDHTVYLIAVRQNLRTHSRIHLTDSAPYNHYRPALNLSGIKIHTGPCFHRNIIKTVLNLCYFFIHCSNNS